MFYIVNKLSKQAADTDCTGEHDVKPVSDIFLAKCFMTFGEASDFSQNFGDNWSVESFL